MPCTSGQKVVQSLRAVKIMIHAVQTNTFPMPTVWKKSMNVSLRKMGSVFGVLCCRKQGAWNGGGGILKEVTERYYNSLSLRLDPENVGSHGVTSGRTLRREMVPDKNGMKNTLFRSPLVVA